MKQLLFLIAFLGFLQVKAQNNAIAAGEKLSFTAAYNMSGIMTDLAEVTMETSEVKTSKSNLLRLKCKATTYSKWDNFFRIRDLYESYVNPKSLTPYLYKRDINEGGYYKFMQYKFNHKTKTVQSLKKKKGANGIWEEKKDLKINNGTKDLVSTLYYIRNLDIANANIGDNMDFKVLFDNVENTVNVRMLGKETVTTKIGKKECYKLALSIKNNDVLKGSNSNVLWLTADANKIPVYAKFKIAVGSGELKIKSASGLKN